MSNPFFSFIIKAVVILIIAFGIHLAILSTLDLPLFENRIVPAYLVNLILVVGIFGVLYLLREKYKSQLGFLFLAGSLLIKHIKIKDKIVLDFEIKTYLCTDF